MRVFYSDDYCATSYSIDATQKPRWIAESLNNDPITGVIIEEPVAAAAEELATIHEERYLNAVRTGNSKRLAGSSSYPWNENTWQSATLSCGGMVAACRAALEDGVSGSLSAGFHHARRERGRYHCVFNGLALAVQQLRDSGVERVLHIDLDAHCGGGTFSLVGEQPRYHQLDVSLFATDRFSPTGQSTLDLVETAELYLPTIRRRLDEISAQIPSFQLCIYYAGMDPHEGSGFGGLPGIDTEMLAERDELVFSTLRNQNVPVAFGLGGGYLGPGLDRDGLVDLHRKTIEIASQA